MVLVSRCCESLLVEDGNRPSHPDDDQRLARQHGKDNGAEHRGQQHLVDAILHVCLVKHVKRDYTTISPTLVSRGSQPGVSTPLTTDKQQEEINSQAKAGKILPPPHRRYYQTTPSPPERGGGWGGGDHSLCKIHVHRRRHHAVVPRVRPVARVVRRPPSHVVDHAAEKVDPPPRSAAGSGSASAAASLPFGRDVVVVVVVVKVRVGGVSGERVGAGPEVGRFF